MIICYCLQSGLVIIYYESLTVSERRLHIHSAVLRGLLLQRTRPSKTATQQLAKHSTITRGYPLEQKGKPPLHLEFVMAKLEQLNFWDEVNKGKDHFNQDCFYATNSFSLPF